MEVHDFDQEHLESVLKDEDQHQEVDTPTNVARAARRLQTAGDENDTSKERYALLPDYAQASFVRSSGETNDQEPLSIQDSREDVEQNLPMNIKTVGALFYCV